MGKLAKMVPGLVSFFTAALEQKPDQHCCGRPNQSTFLSSFPSSFQEILAFYFFSLQKSQQVEDIQSAVIRVCLWPAVTEIHNPFDNVLFSCFEFSQNINMNQTRISCKVRARKRKSSWQLLFKVWQMKKSKNNSDDCQRPFSFHHKTCSTGLRSFLNESLSCYRWDLMLHLSVVHALVH